MARMEDLRGLTSVFMYVFSEAEEPTLQRLGVLDVSRLEEDGTLPHGTYEEDGALAINIKGRAYKYKGEIHLTFSSVDGADTFLGKLIFDEDGDRLIVSGSLFSEDPTKFRGRPAAPPGNQEEQPIVITKP